MFHQLNAFNVKQWVWNMFILQEQRFPVNILCM